MYGHNDESLAISVTLQPFGRKTAVGLIICVAADSHPSDGARDGFHLVQ